MEDPYDGILCGLKNIMFSKIFKNTGKYSKMLNLKAIYKFHIKLLKRKTRIFSFKILTSDISTMRIYF